MTTTELEPGLAAHLMSLMQHARPMPDVLRSRTEDWLGIGFNSLRLAVVPGPALIDAVAFACGDTVIMEPTAFQPDTSAGMALLIHEAAHIVQQRCIPDSVGPLSICQDAGLETEANIASSVRSGALHLSRVRLSSKILQCQQTGDLSQPYLEGTMSPPSGNITFAANNSMNEVYPDRQAAFNRAKRLMELSEESKARRTYHFWLPDQSMMRDLGEGECIMGNNEQAMGGAQAAQRTGRYYDFGGGKLIVEHPDDPNSWTSTVSTATARSATASTAPIQVQRGHFHCCAYDIAWGNMQSMYMVPDGGLFGNRRVRQGPKVYRQARRFSFETPSGGHAGHHIYYY